LRYAFIADIHGNLDALLAVLADLDGQQIDEIACLGDIVGYAADPARCIAVVRERARHVVAGNHDYAAAGRISCEEFNEFARSAIMWTRRQLSDEEKEWLGQLLLVMHLDAFSIVHSSLWRPEDFNYIESGQDAAECFREMQKPLCFVGHSHVPVVFFDTSASVMPLYRLDLSSPVLVEGRMIVNVGSVGQPRDEDPRAAYGIYDSDANTVLIRRVTYDIEAAADKVRAAGLPELLAFRLRLGR